MGAVIEKAGWIQIVDKRILVTRNKNKKRFYLPGGKLDAGETKKQALVRELREELNITLIPETIQQVGMFKAQAPGRAKGVVDRMTCFTAEYAGKIAAGSEIGEIAWFGYKDRGRMRAVEKVIFDRLKAQNWID